MEVGQVYDQNDQRQDSMTVVPGEAPGAGTRAGAGETRGAETQNMCWR